MSQAIIEKVKKLRQLAQSSNANEAANAAAAAERLIQEHRIAEAELESETEESVTPITDYLVEPGTSAISWRAQLISALCKGYSCAVWQSSKRVEGTYRTKLAWGVVGAPDDVATVKYQYAFLTIEIIRLAAEHPIKLKGKREFNGAGPGTVVAHVASVAEYLALACDRDGCRDPALRLWTGTSPVGERVRMKDYSEREVQS
jgi:hypothetical protein